MEWDNYASLEQRRDRLKTQRHETRRKNSSHFAAGLEKNRTHAEKGRRLGAITADDGHQLHSDLVIEKQNNETAPARTFQGANHFSFVTDF